MLIPLVPSRLHVLGEIFSSQPKVLYNPKAFFTHAALLDQGWDDSTKNIVDVAERLQDVGIKALTIHGRTRVQLYKGEAD